MAHKRPHGRANYRGTVIFTRHDHAPTDSERLIVVLCMHLQHSRHAISSHTISGAISIDEGTVCLVAPLLKPFHSSVLIITWLEFLVIMCMGQG